MKISMHTMAVDSFAPMLRSLAAILGKGAEHIKAKGLDQTALMNARLAPDMFPLPMQVQIACHFGRSVPAYLMGREPPPFETEDKTIDSLKARIARTVDYLTGLPAAAFEGAEDRDIKHALGNDLTLEMKGLQYLRDWALPHFYFHVVTAYDILRHNGVEIGKRDYINHVGDAIKEAQAAKV